MRLGVVGTGWISDSFLESVIKSKLYTISSVCSPRIESASAFANKYGIENVYTKCEDMVKNSDIDVVYIASPNNFHFEQAKMFLKASIHAIVEKPITLSLDELNKIELIAKENNVFFIEAMRPIHHPHLKLIKDKIEEIKPIRYAYFQFMRYSSKYDKYKRGEQARVFLPEFGGGALNDLGVYPLTIALYLFGKPNDVEVMASLLESGVDGTTVVMLKYTNFVCVCAFSKISTSYIENEIQGENEAIIINHITHLDKIIKISNNEKIIIKDEHIKEDMIYEILSFTNMIKNNDNAKFQELLSYSKNVIELSEALREKMN
ncbi:Gfo/Idh/MocA family oxidoreductase [Mycoplasmatota bacterium WC44]